MLNGHVYHDHGMLRYCSSLSLHHPVLTTPCIAVAPCGAFIDAGQPYYPLTSETRIHFPARLGFGDMTGA
jgi:hypothetical protein